MVEVDKKIKEYFFSQDGLTRGVQLSKGLDRLKFGFYVDFELEVLFDHLSDAKHEAQRIRQPVPVQLGPDSDFLYNCHSNGRKGGYNFHLSRADVNIFISTRSDFMNTPNVWVDIGSSSCWAPGYDRVITNVAKLCRLYTGKIIKSSVSEVHLCVDCIGLPIEQLDISTFDKWITRANKFNSYFNRSKFSGISLDQQGGFLQETGVVIGQGDICLRVYDKVFEILKNGSKKSLFASVWGVNEFDDHPVTRVEYQLRKTVLKQFSIKSLPSLFKKLSSLWSYCTYDWSRLSSSFFDRQNRHQDRAKIHPWWELIHSIDWNTTDICTRKKPLAQKDKTQLRSMMGGCALNLAAINRVDLNDIDQIKECLLNEIEDWVSLISKKKDKETGFTELQQKMQKKMIEVWPYGVSAEVHGPNASDSGDIRFDESYIKYDEFHHDLNLLIYETSKEKSNLNV